MISSLQGIGFDSAQSWSRLREAPRMLQILYFLPREISLSWYGEGEGTYQTSCKSLKLALSFKVLLLEDTYEAK